MGIEISNLMIILRMKQQEKTLDSSKSLLNETHNVKLKIVKNRVKWVA